MTKTDIIYILLVVFLVRILATDQDDIIDITLPNVGNVQGASRVLSYQNVLDITTRQYIRFSIKARNNAHLLLSEKLAYNINYNADDFIEIGIGEYSNSKSIIRVRKESTAVH